MTSQPDPAAVAKHFIELCGGHKNASEMLDAGYNHLNKLWDQDAGTIGRILRAHLFVEHFVTELLQFKCPQLGSLENARLSFGQKISLLIEAAPEVDDLVPGIRHLNKIRNRIAHSLHANLTAHDAEVLLSSPFFRALREALAESSSEKPTSEPLSVSEDFALHVGTRIQAIVSGSSALWSDAFRLATNSAPENEAI